VIIVTGAAGFIGSNIVADLEEDGHEDIVVCDTFGTDEKWKNISKRQIAAFISPDKIQKYIENNSRIIRCIIHMGAISATTEKDVDKLVEINVNYSVMLWDICSEFGIPFIYASSAATYGAKESELFDDESRDALHRLRPLNAYGWSKKVTDQIFTSRVASGKPRPPQWVGLKFFNVYGPNEYHKGDMKSVIAKLYDPIKNGERVKLFKSDRTGIADGEQKRDFIYVKDCTRTILWILKTPRVNGIFNIGTGEARSFADLASAIAMSLSKEVLIDFVDMPENLKGKYQYFTRAEMAKLRGAGLNINYHSLEDGIDDYVKGYLDSDDRYR